MKQFVTESKWSCEWIEYINPDDKQYFIDKGLIQKDYIEPKIEESKQEIDNSDSNNINTHNPLVYNDNKIKEIEKLSLEEILRYGTAWSD